MNVIEIWGAGLSQFPPVLPFVFKILTVKNEKGLLQPEMREVYAMVCALKQEAEQTT